VTSAKSSFSLQFFLRQIEGVDAIIGELRQKKRPGNASERGGGTRR